MNIERKFFVPITVAVATSVAAPVFGQVEEVLVQARKKEESLQDVPASVSAFTAEQIERGFLRDVRDLQNMVPNVVFDEVNVGSNANAAISMRGVSFQDVEKSFDPAVGVMVDGFFLGSPNGSIYKALDVERIEVLRGPQGTLFGKNTIGGLIHIIRSKPTGELGGKLRLGGGRFNNFDIDALINLPEWNGLSVKGTISYHSRDGYFTNVVNGQEVGEEDFLSYGFNVLWQPREDFSIEYRFDRSEDDGDIDPIVNNSLPTSVSCTAFGVCGTGADSADSAFGGRYNVGSDMPYDDQFFDATTHIARFTWDINENYTVQWISGFQRTEEDILSNFGGTPFVFNPATGLVDDMFFAGRRFQDYNQYSNEVQLTGRPTDRINFVAGVYQWHAEYNMGQNFFLSANPAAGGLGTPGFSLEASDLFQRSAHETDSWSVFGEVDFLVTDRVTLTGGFRYIDEEKEIRHRWLAPLRFIGLPDLVLYDACMAGGQATDLAVIALPPGVTLQQYLAGICPEQDWNDTIYRASIKYDWTDDINTWFTYSTGFRSGGFNGRGNSLGSGTTPYDPEEVENFEVGLHSRFAGGTVQFNAAYFHTTYDSMQIDVNQPGGPSGQETVVNNAASATVQGIELDAVWIPIDNWTLTGSLGWLDAEYDRFFTDLLGTGVPADFSDLELRRAPELSFTINSLYEHQIGPGTASLRVNYAWKDDYETIVNNARTGSIDSYGILDMSLNYDWDRYSISVFGRNITDEDYYTHAFAVPLTGFLWNFAVPREPAVWGVEASVTF